ncbi:MAG: hypothetical protein QM605_03265 [Sphingobium sp.]
MKRKFRAAWLLAAFTMAAWHGSAQARSSQWWYVARGADEVVFVDEKSIEREGDEARYTSNEVRAPGEDTGTRRAFMRADCRKRTREWKLVMRYGTDDQPLDPAAVSYAEAEEVQPGTLGEAELDFVCAADRSTTGGFPIAIDDVAFAKALFARDDMTANPADIHDRMKADPSTPVIRSSAPPTATFGTEQHVGAGQPIVPPRDYATGTEPPNPPDYDADETGRIYDIAYQGVEKGQITFETRGYSIDDMVHPGSGQMTRLPMDSRTAQIRDFSITIVEAKLDGLRYRVVRQVAKDSGMPDMNE